MIKYFKAKRELIEKISKLVDTCQQIVDGVHNQMETLDGFKEKISPNDFQAMLDNLNKVVNNPDLETSLYESVLNNSKL